MRLHRFREPHQFREPTIAAVLIVAAGWALMPGVVSANPQTAEEEPADKAAPIGGEEPGGEEPASPAAPPATDIYLVDFDTSSSPWKVGKVTRVTDRDAYDNQPYFEGDGESLLFTSAGDEQTDVARYLIAEATTESVTETAESEYSPTPTPGWPGFSAVRVEADGTQRLWRFCGSGSCAPEIVFEHIKPVGYHAWIDSETVAMFVLGEPHELVVASTRTQEPETIATDIGRALHRVPGKNAVSFVDKSNAEMWTVSILDLDSGTTSRIIQTPPESEDFVWWSDGEILIGQGSKLYLFDLEVSDAWKEVADLAEHGIRGITRMSPAPHGESLALVAERSE